MSTSSKSWGSRERSRHARCQQGSFHSDQGSSSTSGRTSKLHCVQSSQRPSGPTWHWSWVCAHTASTVLSSSPCSQAAGSSFSVCSLRRAIWSFTQDLTPRWHCPMSLMMVSGTSWLWELMDREWLYMPPAESRVFMQTLGGTVRRDWLQSSRAPSCWGVQASNKPQHTLKEPSASLTLSLLHRQLTTTAGTLRNSAGKLTHTGLIFLPCCLFFHENQTSQLPLLPQSVVARKQPRRPHGWASPGVLPLPPRLSDM